MTSLEMMGKLKPHELHKLVMDNIMAKSRQASKGITDMDVIKQEHRFLWDETGDGSAITWEEQLAKKYYSKLFKEYCICDLSRYKENKVALRWRIEQEVVLGKGQFICGNKVCDQKEGLNSWEVNFNYVERGERKNALVKLRLCEKCSKKLNHHSKKRLIKKARKRLKNGRPGSSKSILKADPIEHNTAEETVGAAQEGAEEDVIRNETEAVSNTNLWSSKAPIEERSREEEFNDYLEDLLL